jgi:hypothetical protein
MRNKDGTEYIVVPQRVFEDLQRVGMEAGVVPVQRIPSESFADYVKRYPKAP